MHHRRNAEYLIEETRDAVNDLSTREGCRGDGALYKLQRGCDLGQRRLLFLGWFIAVSSEVKLRSSSTQTGQTLASADRTECVLSKGAVLYPN